LIDADAARDAKILKQVEFYFSDSNFPKDKFLKAQAALNADGSMPRDARLVAVASAHNALSAADVPIATIATFERMKKIGGTLEDVVRVMRSSDQLEVPTHGLDTPGSDARVSTCEPLRLPRMANTFDGRIPFPRTTSLFLAQSTLYVESRVASSTAIPALFGGSMPCRASTSTDASAVAERLPD
jgi:hypothetical protein